ncbi:hypothetical protein [Litorimonas sp. WD9-15]|uniref:hypothetical protein n=1 Tax=Litorimonas sp. WD9-15 TaxID=3418716 RepID=UPI003D059AE5
MSLSKDYQRVRSHRPYTIVTLAELLEVNPATIRRWINLHGLDVAITNTRRPIILNGAKIKDWMKARQVAKRKPCGPNEMYCVRCKVPRQIKGDTFHIIQRNASKLTVKGDCKTCGLTLQRFGSVANRAALEAVFCPKRSDNPAA